MDKLYPIVRRVRRPLLPAEEVVSREEAGTCVPANALRATGEEVSREEAKDAKVEHVTEESLASSTATETLPENEE